MFSPFKKWMKSANDMIHV